MKKIATYTLAMSLLAAPALAEELVVVEFPEFSAPGSVADEGNHNVFMGSTNIGNVSSTLTFGSFPSVPGADLLENLRELSHNVIGATTGYENNLIGVVSQYDGFATNMGPLPEVEVIERIFVQEVEVLGEPQ